MKKNGENQVPDLLALPVKSNRRKLCALGQKNLVSDIPVDEEHVRVEEFRVVYYEVWGLGGLVQVEAEKGSPLNKLARIVVCQCHIIHYIMSHPFALLHNTSLWYS